MHSLPTFLNNSKKKGKEKEKRKSFKKLFKGFHPGQNVTVLAILERLEFKNFLRRPPAIFFSIPWPLHFEMWPLVVSDLGSETKGSRFEFSCYLMQR